MKRATSSTADPAAPAACSCTSGRSSRLFAKIKQDGYTLVPLSVYFKDARVKVEVGLCKGKKLYDKRDAAAKKDAKREMDRALKLQRGKLLSQNRKS